MGFEIAVQERPITHYVGVPLSARFAEFDDPSGPNQTIARVYQWLADHEIAPLGGPLYIYRHFGASHDEPVDLTVAVPVAAAVTPTEGLAYGNLPGGTYLVGRFVGHPDGFAACQPEVHEWAELAGLRLGGLEDENGVLWTGYAENYLTDPAEEPDLSKWVTELLFKTVE